MARDADLTEFAATAYPSLVRTARLLTGDYRLAEDLSATKAVGAEPSGSGGPPAAGTGPSWS